MIRRITLLDDAAEIARLTATAANAVLNDIEYRRGATRLASYPPNMRITMATRCNLPETSQPCAYCAWDWAKTAEIGAPAFSPATLDQLGAFYGQAQAVGDCSIGEPAMHRQFGAVLDRFDAEGKPFSFTTNGQLLTAQRRREMLGKDLDVYVSIDAADAEGFRRYRNDRFETIIANLRALCAEKRAHGNLPRVTASFIAMRSNADQIKPYIRLMTEVGVDSVKLRMLFADDYAVTVVDNNGYHFDYAAEMLDNDELNALAAAARRHAGRHGITLYVEWEQFEPRTEGAGTRPICAEPWKTFYPLARGITPCCYGSEPLARWDEQGDRPMEIFLRGLHAGSRLSDAAMTAGLDGIGAERVADIIGLIGVYAVTCYTMRFAGARGADLV